MQEVTAEATRQQFDRWIEEGQHLAASLPGLFDENDRLRSAVAAAEKERDSAQRELEDTKAENHALRNECTAMQDAFSKFMNELQQLMDDVVRKLNTTPSRGAFVR
jgi:predicted  nucleic acid-binding Zn-ribbon protein